MDPIDKWDRSNAFGGKVLSVTADESLEGDPACTVLL